MQFIRYRWIRVSIVTEIPLGNVMVRYAAGEMSSRAKVEEWGHISTFHLWSHFDLPLFF
jgi:hypothetical protein